MKLDIKKSFSTRTFRAGSVSLILTVIVVAIAIAANVLISFLPDKVKNIDVTEQGNFSLSDEMVEILKSYDTDINITYIVEAGGEEPLVEQLLNRACSENSHITLSHLDPAVHPEQASKYECTPNSFVVTAGERQRVVDSTELIEHHYYLDGSEITADEYQQYGYYYQMGMTDKMPEATSAFCGQSALASALRYVTTDKLPVIYTLTGHSELVLDEKFASYLKTDNVDVKELSLVSEGSVPENADALLLLVPKADLSPDETDAIEEYVRGGGQVIVYTYYQYNETENLDALLGGFGMKRLDGFAVDTKKGMYSSSYTNLLPNVIEGEYTEEISGMYVNVPSAHGITKLDEMPEGVTVDEILSTSDESFVRPTTSESESVEFSEGDVKGPFMISACASVEGGGQIIWNASPYLCVSDLDYNGAISTLFLAMAEKNAQIEASVALATKPMEVTYLTISSADRTIWGVTIIGLVPIAFLIAGIYVWAKRKRR